MDAGGADTIPVIDVAQKVAAGMSEPAVAAGGAVLTENLYLTAPGSVNGDLTITGDIVLSGGTLFVDGDLDINGGIKGRGAIYVSGNLNMLGGNTVVQTGEPNGVALMVEGNASFEGVNADGYLNFLAGMDSDIQTALGNMNGQLSNYPSASNPDALYAIGVNLSKHPYFTSPAPPTPTDIWVNPIPGPNGWHNVAYRTGYIPALILEIKDTGLHLTDGRAQKVVSALEDMAYHFRDNDIYFDMTGLELNDQYQVVEGVATWTQAIELDPLTGPTGLRWEKVDRFDDKEIAPRFRTHTSLAYQYVPGPGEPSNYELSDSRRRSFIANNPLDFSFLSDSVFQGMIYVGGNVEAEHNFSIVGALLTQGSVTLTNGSKLIFNEEYRDLLGEAVPIGILHFEEI